VRRGGAAIAELDALAAMCAAVGADPDLVQGGGGNASLKLDGRLWIKASGTWLSRALAEPLFLPLDLERLQRQILAGAADPTAGCYDTARSSRPSIETTLHALLPGRVVLHTHAVNTIAWAVRSDGEAMLVDRLASLDWAWVPYRRPGLPLTRAVQAVLRRRPACAVLVLANHGLVVGAEDAEGARTLTHEVERRLAREPRAAAVPDLPRLQALAEAGWRLPQDPLVHAIACDAAALEMARRGALYPDHVVFLDAPLPVLSEGGPDAARRRHREATGRDPCYLVLPGAGVVVAREIAPGAEEMLRCLARVLLRLPGDAPVRPLDADQVRELVSWEAEQYRQALNAGPA